MIALKTAQKEGQAQKTHKELEALGELLINDPEAFFSLICGATDFFPMEIEEKEKMKLNKMGFITEDGVLTPTVRQAVQMMFCG